MTKLSGSGSDSIFLGVIRPLPPNPHVMRAWLSPNGTFLCADQQFASAVGRSEGELVRVRECACSSGCLTAWVPCACVRVRSRVYSSFVFTSWFALCQCHVTCVLMLVPSCSCVQVGHALLALAVSAEAVEALLERCKAATAAELEGGEVVVSALELVHRYLPEPLALEVAVGLAGAAAGVKGWAILVLGW